MFQFDENSKDNNMSVINCHFHHVHCTTIGEMKCLFLSNYRCHWADNRILNAASLMPHGAMVQEEIRKEDFLIPGHE